MVQAAEAVTETNENIGNIYIDRCACFRSNLAFYLSGINVHSGMNVGVHVAIALAICYTILATCAISVNVIHRNCKCARQP